MSRPNIALHNQFNLWNVIMLNELKKNYTLQFKLQVVREVEDSVYTVSQAQRNYGIQSRSTVVKWLEKYGNFDPHYKVKKKVMKTAEQIILA